MRAKIIAACMFLVVGCGKGAKEEITASPPVTASPSASSATAVDKAGALHLGAPIDANAQTAALKDIARDPKKYDKTTVATTGTVTAVCQSMGCWMEIKDDGDAAAHIKMAGHAFFIPKTASGKKARVLAQVVVNDTEGSCADDDDNLMSTQSSPAAAKNAKAGKPEKKGCRAEAEDQLGHPLAKLELVALGVELYD